MSAVDLLVALRVAVGGASIVLLADGIYMAATSNSSIGIYMQFYLVAVLAAYAIFWWRLVHYYWLHLIVGIPLLIWLGISIFLAAYGNQEHSDYQEDAAIVLGAALRGDAPSFTLENRLNAAIEYSERNPKALLVVSGGQGPGETTAEGNAMRSYLLAHGVDDAKIVVENRSTSTETNLLYSKSLLDARLNPGYRTVVVTNDFHVYRATILARDVGLNSGSISAGTAWYAWPSNYLREVLAVLKLWVFGP
ncbi:MAG: YdcF family protein [Propionibacteriaceae bacterium]|jgi:uncharacterized SAM-binding protein YcdF (DUF218 family)|nr:YdcF family protein [Propionibacteriaceae bacterium]